MVTALSWRGGKWDHPSGFYSFSQCWNICFQGAPRLPQVSVGVCVCGGGIFVDLIHD